MSIKVKAVTVIVFSPIEEDAGMIRAYLENESIPLGEWNQTGSDFAKSWLQVQPSIAFVDYVMPKRDGLSVVKNIRQLDPECKTVFMHSFSGLAANELEAKALAAGANGILQKPITEAKLRLLVDRLLKK